MRMKMFRRATSILIVLSLLFVLTITIQGTGVFKDIDWPWKGTDEVAERIASQGIMYGYGDGKFHPNGTLTNKQALIVFNRLMSNKATPPILDNTNFNDHVLGTAYEYNVSLPSDLVYYERDWKNVWRDILTGKTVFEKLGDDKYSVTLIPGYFKIYLNDKGYLLFKKGMIPPQIEFYSPYTTIDNLSEETLNQPATKGFVMELMSLYDMKKNIGGYNSQEIAELEDEVINILSVISIEQTINKIERDWNSLDIDKYNYVSMSYGGAMQYGILRGIIQADNTLEDMNKPITRIEFATIIDRINNRYDNMTLEDALNSFIDNQDIEVFSIYLNR